ncbi:MAG: DUF4198 domain-containing protein [Gammaproteobacteria bacterium]|nr:DUF4198 domain-containing protein [Gammaproteobacteria bacterium]
MHIDLTGHHFYRLVLVSTLFFFSNPVLAHEFWLETAQSQQDSALYAKFYNGEGFRGESVAQQAQTTRHYYVYNDNTGTRTPIVQQATATTSQSLPQLAPGLSVIAYQSTDALHRYKSFQEFSHFARAEGLHWAIDSHRSRQLPESYFSEIVKRYSKALVCLDHATGSDRMLGLDLELTLKFNPFDKPINRTAQIQPVAAGDDLDWKVQLTSVRDRVQGTQITLFHRNPDGLVTSHRLRTDRDGIASIPELGAGDYLLNAVTLRAPSLRDSFKSGAVWESHWSSLTFSYGQACYHSGGIKVSTEPSEGNP